jgi:hypothetical protein
MPGAYAVSEDAGTVRIVGKNKVCSCGGNAEQECPHIRAVKMYLRHGGQQAPSAQRPWRWWRRSMLRTERKQAAAERLRAYWRRIRLSQQDRQGFLAQVALKPPYPYAPLDPGDRMMAGMVEQLAELIGRYR